MREKGTLSLWLRQYREHGIDGLKSKPKGCSKQMPKPKKLRAKASQEDHDKIVLNEEISVIGYITDLEEGVKLLTKGGNQYDLKAQGWNAFNS